MKEAFCLLAGGMLVNILYFVIRSIRYNRIERTIQKERDAFEKWAENEPSIYKKRLISFDLYKRHDHLIKRM